MKLATLANHLVHILAFGLIITIIALVCIGLDALFDEAPTRAELYRDAAIAFIGGLWLGLFSATAKLRHARWLHALSLAAAGLVILAFFNLDRSETTIAVAGFAVLGFSANSWLRSL